MPDVGYLGIDVGSISTNLVLIDSCEDVVSDIYVRGSGSPIMSLQEGIARIQKEVGSDVLPVRDRKAGKKTRNMKLQELINEIKAETANKPFKPLALPKLLSKRPQFAF